MVRKKSLFDPLLHWKPTFFGDLKSCGRMEKTIFRSASTPRNKRSAPIEYGFTAAFTSLAPKTNERTPKKTTEKNITSGTNKNLAQSAGLNTPMPFSDPFSHWLSSFLVFRLHGDYFFRVAPIVGFRRSRNRFICLICLKKAKLINLGIGDTTEPLPSEVAEALSAYGKNLGTLAG